MESHTCIICDQSYNTSTKRPLVLPCSHSFCRECLHNVEVAGNKQCPYCRASWSNAKLSDLPSCYQLIPDSGTVPRLGGCGDHGDRYNFWCESCEVPACKKCLSLEHKSCNWTLMEDKVDKLREKREAILYPLTVKKAKYSANLLKNDSSLASVRPMFQNLRLVEREMLIYKETVETWQVVAEKMLANLDSLLKSNKRVKTKKINSTFLEELERKIPPRPSSLLTHIAIAYQSSNEDIDEFFSELRNSVEAGRADEEEDKPPKSKTSFKEAVAALTEGGDWVVSDDVASAAVQNVLQITSVRPKSVLLDVKNITDTRIQKLANFFTKKPYKVEVLESMDSFLAFEEPAAEMRSITTCKLDFWIQSVCWGSLTQFWGHLDAAAVKKLPATIQSLGLVLRDQEDMAAVNALSGAAFEAEYEHIHGRRTLKWSSWTALDLSVAKTFLPDHWELTWPWPPRVNKMETIMKHHYVGFDVRVRIHLPQLVPGDRGWMGDLFRGMGMTSCGSCQNRITLQLPGARMDPDSLLGVLRDSTGRCDVHLPASQPQLVPREEVAERYKRYGHCVTWDLE